MKKFNALGQPLLGDRSRPAGRRRIDTVARRLRELGVAPDGRIGTAYQDLLFESLRVGPLDTGTAVSAFSHRLTQFG